MLNTGSCLLSDKLDAWGHVSLCKDSFFVSVGHAKKEDHGLPAAGDQAESRLFRRRNLDHQAAAQLEVYNGGQWDVTSVPQLHTNKDLASCTTYGPCICFHYLYNIKLYKITICCILCTHLCSICRI